jgi:alkyl sulfatase BDS1-like metallo-beta-lactamase superfamily hydrolase
MNLISVRQFKRTKNRYTKTAEELEAMSEEEWHDFMTQWLNDHPDWGWHNEHEYAAFEGDWNFTLNITKNTEDTQTVWVNEVNDQGIDIEKVVKDRFEITVYDTYTGDADGRMRLSCGSGF